MPNNPLPAILNHAAIKRNEIARRMGLTQGHFSNKVNESKGYSLTDDDRAEIAKIARRIAAEITGEITGE